MGWENARPDRPPPAPRGAHFPTPWPLWRCVSWRGWRGVWWRVFWGWLRVIQGLFGVELALFWRGDIWPFGAPGGSLRGTPGVSRDFYRYDRLLIGQCHILLNSEMAVPNLFFF